MSWSLLLLVLSIIERVILKSLLIMDLSLSPSTSISCCFAYFDALLLGAEKFRIVIFLVNLHICEITSPVSGNILCCNSTLPDINIVTPAVFWWTLTWYIFLYSFTFNQFVSFYLKWVSFRQQTVESYFLWNLIISAF